MLVVVDREIYLKAEILQLKSLVLKELIKIFVTYIFGVNHSVLVGSLWNDHNLILQEDRWTSGFPMIESTCKENLINFQNNLLFCKG